LYRYEAWFLTLRKEHRLGKIFDPRRDMVTRKWRRLHNKELYALYSSPNIFQVINSRRMRWVRHVAHIRDRTGTYRALVYRPKARRQLGRPRHRWEDNIKMAHQEVGCGGMDMIGLVQDRDRLQVLGNVVMNLDVP
jgi:hypothetical protein